MKIQMEGTLVEFKPENEKEVNELSVLWDLIVDCVQTNRKLVPVGEYVPQDPGKNKVARFNIEDN